MMLGNKINGLLVTYLDDQLNESVRSTLKGKSRVRYKCMDAFANFLAFGTSSGAIYLFRLDTVTHSTCSLVSMIPCDQGSIEVIKFLPNVQADDLLISIGTSRGSIVVFSLFQAPGEHNTNCEEIYKAESFTNNSSIKLIESDRDLLDPTCSFGRLFICDSADRLYVLESNTIYANKNSLRIFRQSHLPSLIFSVSDSKINQISVHRSNLLISTDGTTRLFNEQSNELNVIGKKKRKLGFYGACFFNPNYKPNMQSQKLVQQSRNTSISSLTTVNDLDNLLIFVARPMFRMWQVSHKCDVLFTHQFEPLLKASRFTDIVEIENDPYNEDRTDDPSSVISTFESNLESESGKQLRGDHFHKLISIYSSTLGNLLLSYSQYELYVIDPIGAELVTWCSFETPIIQVCCNDNEIFVWSQMIENDQKQFHLRRIVLLAPTQFVLELHRIHRYTTLIMFVQLFSNLFRDKMALPLDGPNTITTEGGLLRNILLNAWDIAQQWKNKENCLDWLKDVDTYCAEFKRIVEEIIDESRQLRSSFENLTDSRFFLAMTNENIDRLLSEPYASLVSLEVSIAELHTSHVIHFNEEALNRHKSVANLSQNIKAAIHEANNRTKSSVDLTKNGSQLPLPSKSMRDLTKPHRLKAQVIVEHQRPKRNVDRMARSEERTSNKPELGLPESNPDIRVDTDTFFSLKECQENLASISENTDGTVESDKEDLPSSDSDEVQERKLESLRCKHCCWPKAGSHLHPLNLTQMIQLKWIEDNLATNFIENIDQIEEVAFKHGLWNVYLKCLAYKRQLDEYIICCLSLDDVRLLDFEQLVIICNGEDEMMELILTHLNRTIELYAKKGHSSNGEKVEKNNQYFCIKCEQEHENIDNLKGSTNDIVTAGELDDNRSDISINLATLLDQFIMRHNSNIRKMVGHLLNFPNLLNNSKLPIRLYLKSIENTINRSRTITKRSPHIEIGLDN